MQGSLSEFRLSEILQLVAVQQKTGLLRLVRGSQVVTFYFDHGTLVATRDRRHTSHDPLLDYLGRTGWLQPEMVSLLRARLESAREDLLDMLVEERFLGEDEVEIVLADLAQELVHQAFAWRDGTYQFVGGDEALAGLRRRLQFKIDSLLMEAARRADEWPRLQEKLPGGDVIVDLAHPPSADLGDRAYGVLSQITGATRLGDLVRRARVPEFETYEIVSQGVDAGLVRVLERPAPVPEPRAALETGRERPKQRRARPRHDMWQLPRPLAWGFTLGVVALAALFAVLGAPRLEQRETREGLRALDAACTREDVRLQLEVYRALHGRYPDTLDDLVAADLASPALLERARPLGYAPRAAGRDFDLAAPADGRPASAR
jgi:hypothetical protein